jgi:hypothetical protein
MKRTPYFGKQVNRLQDKILWSGFACGYKIEKYFYDPFFHLAPEKMPSKSTRRCMAAQTGRRRTESQ